MDNFWAEWMVEDSWRVSCKLMHEIELEFGGTPVITMLAGKLLISKWLSYVGRN